MLPIWPASVALGVVLHLGWNVLDGADGELARRTGRGTPFGEVIDGLCDYFGHIILYVTLAAMLSPSLGVWAWAAATAAGLSRIVQANHYETLRRTYAWRVHGASWLRRSGGADRMAQGPSLAGRAVARLAQAYVALSWALSRRGGAVDDQIAALADRPQALAATRALTRQIEVPAVRRAALLSADLRTLVLGASMLLKTPLWYFLFEATVLNVVLVWSLAAQARRNRRFLQELQVLAAD